MNATAVILAGGSGTRLWPLSRKMMPKQLLALTGRYTLLQETCRRLWPAVPPERQWVITGLDHYPHVLKKIEDLRHEGCHEEKFTRVIQEPESKNTAPAIFYAAKRCMELFSKETVLIVLPADHFISDRGAFIALLNKAVAKAGEGYLVTFGIQPGHPETGYGYIKEAGSKHSDDGFRPVEAFVEKPDLPTAQKYLARGGYLWNSGMFVFHVGTLFAEARKHCPAVADPFYHCHPFDEQSVAKAYEKVRACSIDHALMEKTTKALVAPASMGWTDVGNWQSLYHISEKDHDGNVMAGEAILIDTKNSLIRTSRSLIAAVGLNGMAVIDMPDALLVCPLEKSQGVKDVVERLKEQNSPLYVLHPTVERPWGSYTVIQEGAGYKIKKIVVLPQQTLSLQKHRHRSEHWVVVKGTAKVQIDSSERLLHENQSAFVPKASVHMLGNPGLVNLEVIEIQWGSPLSEDDIVRLEDRYGR